MATLTIQLPGLPPVSHVLKDETITVGRMKGNNIVIDDASVSLTHARITRRNGEFYVKDLNSTNGTVINGQRINEAKLRDNDRVSFADITAQFQAEATAAASSQAPKPIVPEPAKTVSQPSPAPSPITAAPARPPAAPAPVFREEEDEAVPFSAMRLVTRLVGILGGAVALGVVCFLGWKMFHGGFDDSPTHLVARESSTPQEAVKPPANSLKKSVVPVSGKSEPAPAPSPSHPPQAGPATESIPQLAKALKDPDPTERRRAATTLHALGSQAKAAAPELREALKDSDQDVRMWAALTLVNNELHDKATIPILIGVLQRENPVLRQVACLSLGLIPYEEYERDTVVPALAETASTDGDDEVRKAAVSALNIIDPTTAARVIIK